MDTEEALKRVRAAEPKLRQMGVLGLALFGSRVCGDAGADSDFDFAVTLDGSKPIGLLDYAGIQLELQEIVGTHVDLVSEPARKERFQKQIDRWRRNVF